MLFFSVLIKKKSIPSLALHFVGEAEVGNGKNELSQQESRSSEKLALPEVVQAISPSPHSNVTESEKNKMKSPKKPSKSFSGAKKDK